MKFIDKSRPWRPMYVGALVFAGIGYGVYLAAYFLPTPQWGRELVAWAKPVLGGLVNAQHVGTRTRTDPFPTQAVILYSAGSVFVLFAWFAGWSWGSSALRTEILNNYKTYMKPKDRSKGRLILMTFVGVPLMFAMTLVFYLAPPCDSCLWLAEIYSSKLSSITFLLLQPFFAASIFCGTPFFFYMTFSSFFDETNLKQPVDRRAR